MGGQFLFITVALFAAVLVLETLAVRTRPTRQKRLKENCMGRCMYQCTRRTSAGEGQCGLFKKCCKSGPVEELFAKPGCSTYGGTCRGNGKRVRCPDTEAAVQFPGAPCPNKSETCCLKKPPNPTFEDGIYKIVDDNAVYLPLSSAITSRARPNQRSVRIGAKTASRGVHNRRRLYALS